MNCIIRRIRKDDYGKVRKMMHALWRIHGTKSAYINNDYLEAYDADKEIRKKNKEILVAEVDGKVVGYTYVSVKKAEDFFKFRRYLYLDEIFVEKKYRGKGIGRKLLKQTQKMAKTKKLPALARIYPFSKQALGLVSGEGGEVLHSTFIFPNKKH